MASPDPAAEEFHALFEQDYVRSITRSAIRAGAWVCECDDPVAIPHPVPVVARCQECSRTIDPDRQP